MTAPNMVVAGATYALTHRCAFRKLFLTPSTPVVHQGLLYALALALQATRTRMHHGVFMPNHPHLTVTPTEANLPEFKRLFYGESSKFVKVALAEHGYEPPERIFSEGLGHHMRLVNAAAQLTYLHYQDVNTIKAGLVEEVAQYPGFSSDLGLMNGGVMTVKRPPFYFEQGPEEIEIHFSMPPVLERHYGSTRELIHQLRRARTDKERALAQRRTFPVLGALEVTRQHPWSEPRSPRRFRAGPKPSFMVVRDKALHQRCCEETVDFRERHEKARVASLAGEEAVFPYGTYAKRVLHGARVEDVSATEGRILAAPGRLEPRGQSAPRDQRRELNRALRQEAAEVKEDELDETLAEQLHEAKAHTVERRHANTPVTDVEPPRTDGSRKLSKRVVTRDSTASARRRRRETQRLRAERTTDPGGANTANTEHADPDSPPH